MIMQHFSFEIGAVVLLSSRYRQQLFENVLDIFSIKICLIAYTKKEIVKKCSLYAMEFI
jgi:hypothetical protein